MIYVEARNGIGHTVKIKPKSGLKRNLWHDKQSCVILERTMLLHGEILILSIAFKYLIQTRKSSPY